MKMIKHILVLSAVTIGLNASAQMHESKQEPVKGSKKVTTVEKAKPMPDGKIKAESTTPANTSVQNEQKTEKQTTNTVNDQTKTNTTTGNDQQPTKGNQKMRAKQIKRPVKTTAPAQKLDAPRK